MLRVNNFAASEPYDVDITYEAPMPLKPAQVESYTLTCEQGGRVLDTQQVQIDRGQVRQLDLSACTRQATPGTTGTTGKCKKARKKRGKGKAKGKASAKKKKKKKCKRKRKKRRPRR